MNSLQGLCGVVYSCFGKNMDFRLSKITLYGKATKIAITNESGGCISQYLRIFY